MLLNYRFDKTYFPFLHLNMKIVFKSLVITIKKGEREYEYDERI